ncbi:MAG: glycosyltransferase, partial [Ginsengibacter sp.]
MKKTILYIIDSLGAIGGAEIMMVSPLEEIHLRYNIIIVTLQPGNVFENRGCVFDKYYCINMNSRINVFNAAKKLKKIINENNVSLVHSFLYWSVVVARLACGKKTPHIFSLATMMTEHIYKHKWYSGYTKIIDKITYKKNQVLISPSNEVIKDFDNAVGIKGKHKVLYNFVSDDFFKNEINYSYSSNTLKLVSVGNIKTVKNYQVLIDAFKLFNNVQVSLDIYGEGDLKKNLQDQITEYNLPVKLMGSHK